MNYAELLKNARENMNGNCKACKICNGEACRGVMPGPGGKATGDGFVRSYNKLQQIKVHMDTIYEEAPIDTSCTFFGQNFAFPAFAAPIAGTPLQYGPKYDQQAYTKAVVDGCKNAGTLAFTFFDPTDDETLKPIKEAGGWGIPTVKPWPLEVMAEQFKASEEAGALAVCTDVDGAGLALVQGGKKPCGSQVCQTACQSCAKCKNSRAHQGRYDRCRRQKSHGCRRLRHCSLHPWRSCSRSNPAPIEMLEEICKVVQGNMKVFIDGGIRSGVDIFKCLAMGADAVLLGRPYPVAVYGGGMEGVSFYTNMLAAQFKEAMMMTATQNIKEITRDKIFIDKSF